MRRAIITICFITLLASICQKTQAAQNKFFYSDGNIMPGEQWENVYVYNVGTTVNMLGGNVDGIASFNASTVNISGGYASGVNALDFSTVNVTGGYVSGLDAYDNGTITFSGNASAHSVVAFDSGNIIMTGGTTDYLVGGYSVTIDLYGGTISDLLSVGDLATANIFGYNLSKVPTGGTYGYGQVSGYWENGESFSINLYNPEAYSHIKLIPEPCSLMLLGFGVLALIRKT